jgi:hypothetical protein
MTFDCLQRVHKKCLGLHDAWPEAVQHELAVWKGLPPISFFIWSLTALLQMFIPKICLDMFLDYISPIDGIENRDSFYDLGLT